MEREYLVALGRIEGKLDMIVSNQRKQDAKLDEMDGRLRKVEQKAAVSGAVGGTIAAIGVAIAAEMVKRVI